MQRGIFDACEKAAMSFSLKSESCTLWAPMVNRTALQASFYNKQQSYVVHTTCRVWRCAPTNRFAGKVLWNGEAITACSCKEVLWESLGKLWTDIEMSSESICLKLLTSLKMLFLLCYTGMWNYTGPVRLIEKNLVELRGKSEAHCWFHSYKTRRAIVACENKQWNQISLLGMLWLSAAWECA